MPPPPISIQSELGDVVYVEVPEVGACSLSKGANLGVVESVKVRTHERHVLGTPSSVRPSVILDPPLNLLLDPSHRRPRTSTLPSVARSRSTLPWWMTCQGGAHGQGKGLICLLPPQ